MRKNEENLDLPVQILRNTLNEMIYGIIVVIDDGDQYPIAFANRFAEDFIGREITTLPSPHPESLLDLIYSSDQNKLKEALANTDKDVIHKESYRILGIGDKPRWILSNHKVIEDVKGRFILISFSNIQELMSVQDKLNADRSKWMGIISNIPIGLAIFTMDLEEEDAMIIAINDRLVTFSNEIGRRLDGNTRDWTMQELSIVLSQNIYAFSLVEDIPQIRRMLSESILSDVTTCVYRLRGSTEEHTIWIRSFCHSKIVAGERIFYVSFSDCTNEMQNFESLQSSHEELRIISYHDALTGLLNRNALNELYDFAFLNPLQDVGIVFCDLNGLKHINDTFGHRFGDRMITRFTSILRSEFSEEVCYRISGDEFVIVVPGIDKEDFKSHMNAILKATEDANEIASIGFLWEKEVTDVHLAVESAEQLMYVEKQRYYATEESRESKRHNTYVSKLLEEIKNGQYVCYLQPKASIHDHVIVGAEALIRKFDKEGKLLAPNLFIPILEHEKVIPMVDFFMLEEVCKILSRWEKEGRDPIKISVNMSRVTLSEYDFMDHMKEIVNKYQINRSLLELEITESNATMDHNLLVDEVAQIHALGIGVSIDDMGTEYSALRMLTIDGIDTVKLDRSFINQMPTKQGRILVRQLLLLCKELEVHSIAEGVETEEQRLTLMELGCEMYQGYLLSKPIPVEDFERLATDSRK